MSLSRLVNRARSDERGVGMVTALMITLVVFALGATWTSVGIHQVGSASFERNREQALDAAEAGVNLALSRLTEEFAWAGTSGVMELGDSTGEFEVAVTPLDPGDPNDLDRYIVARGYAPSKTSARRSARQIEQQVRLVPEDGFQFALFAAPSGIIGQNNSTITGDVYSAGEVVLANAAKVWGDVTAVGQVVTSNSSTIGGSVHTGGNATIDNSQTSVQGNLLAVGDAGGTGSVAGDVQAGGTIAAGLDVGGTSSAGNPPEAPAVRAQPTFTWDDDNYPPESRATWNSDEAFEGHWKLTDPFSGHHNVQAGDGSGETIELDKTWTMAADTTIHSTGPIHLSRDIAAGSSNPMTLTVISMSEESTAISLTNSVTMPSNITMVLFAPNGTIDFSQLKDFKGVVYGEEIRLSQQFTLTYAPPDIPGFDWTPGSLQGVFSVEVVTFREVPFVAA